MNTTVKSVVFWVAMIVLVALVWSFSSRFQRNESLFTFSEFVSLVDSGQVVRVKITGNELTGTMQSKEAFRTYIPFQYEGLVNRLIEKKVIVEAKEPTASPWAALLLSWAPILLLIGSQLIVRHRRPGDRLTPLGAPGRKKVQDVLVDRKVPRDDRDLVPIVTTVEGEIVWVAGEVLADGFRVTPLTTSVVVLTLRR